MATESIRRSIFANVIDNKAVVIGCIRDESHLVLHGSTLQASVASNAPAEKLKTITLYPQQGEEGIIALVIHAFSHRSGGKHDHAQYIEIPVFLKLTWKQEGDTKKPFVDLDNPWYPADRIGQVQREQVEVCIKGKRFATYDHAQWNFNEKKSCPIFVQDGDLLCRYLWGTASAADVLDKAVEKKLEPSLRVRVERLTAEVTMWRHQFHMGEDAHRQLLGRYRTLMDSAHGQFEKNRLLLERHDKLKDAIGMAGWLWRLLEYIPAKLQPSWFVTFKGRLEEYHRLPEVHLF
jgi:hypothetical protein